MADIVILGAGLTGLSTAYHLEQAGFFDYTLFEKEPEAGGLCRSISHEGFTFDYTGHLLHINDEYFKQFIESVVGFEHFNVIHRKSFIYSQNVYTHYPYQVNLNGLPADTIAACIEGFVQRKKIKHQPASFRQWVLSNFGKGLAEHFFFPYQEKIFSFPVDKLSASWTGRFVPHTTLGQMINGALQPPSEQQIGYNAQFFYPKQGGIYFWVKKIHEKLTNPVQLNHTVTRINLREKEILFQNGRVEKFKHLVSTLPLDIFLKLTDNAHFKQTANKLLCNTVVNFNLGIKRDQLSDKHWIYYPERQYPFYRIGFAHNFSDAMAPAGHAALYGEFSHINKPIHEVEVLLKESLVATKKLLRIDDHEVVTQKVITIPHAYVIFDRWRDKNLPALLDNLRNDQIHSVGRYGAWKYSSMQEGILEGKDTACQLLTNAFS